MVGGERGRDLQVEAVFKCYKVRKRKDTGGSIPVTEGNIIGGRVPSKKQ